MASVCLICVVSGPSAYEEYARALFASAREHVEMRLQTLLLRGVDGWPAATMLRYRILLEHWDLIDADYAYLLDADLLFEGPVSEEILAATVAVQHPGYVGAPRTELPYEDRPESACYIGAEEGGTYYAGGLVGGSLASFKRLAMQIVELLDEDEARGIVPRWHDESALNRVLADLKPGLTLSPAYLHPDSDEYYCTFWPEVYPRKIVALDKGATLRKQRAA